MRRAAHIDAAQPEIVAALRGVGCSVLLLAGIGEHDVPDILVAVNEHRTFLAEIKTPGRENTHKQRLATQAEWRLRWKGETHLLRTVDEALALVGAEVNG